MQIEISNSDVFISKEDKEQVQASVVCMPSGVYFRRLYQPKTSTVLYFSKYLPLVLQQNGCRKIIVDYREKDPLTAEMRRLMVKNVKPILNCIDTIIFIMNPNRMAIQRVMLEFFVKAYLRHRQIKVYFCSSKEEAIEKLESS